MKLQVTLFSGAVEVVEVAEFNAEELAAKVNDNQILGIALGSQVFSRIDIKHVKVVAEELEATS